MKSISLLVLLTLSLLPSVCLADAPEVSAARSAAEKHNATIEDASERLEKAIEAARREHTQQIIAAKERMIIDLRRAYRTAIRGDTPENAGVIERQIKRLEAQIEALKRKAAPPVEVKLEGLDPRLIGFVRSHGRICEIDNRGRVTVRYGGGEEDGQTYQGQIKDGRLFVHFAKWTARGKLEGRVQDFCITEDQKFEVRHSDPPIYRTRGFRGALTSSEPLAVSVFSTWEDIPGPYKGEPAVDRKEGEVDPGFVEDEGAIENLEGEVDFFGIPIE